MVAPLIIGAGIGAILPLIMEAMRDKPDPEKAKEVLRSQRQGLVERAIGSGMNQTEAERSVDAQLEQEFAAADEAGEFNTPVGEMVAGAVLGGALPWAGGKLAGMFKGGAKAATAATAPTAAAAAAPVAASMPRPSAIAKPTAAVRPEDEIAAKLQGREAYDAKLKSLDNSDPELQRMVDESMMAGRKPSPFPTAPDFMPGEMEMRVPSKSLKPWESTPEIESILVKRELRKLKADPRGVFASQRSPFPDAPAEDYRASLYRTSGG